MLHERLRPSCVSICLLAFLLLPLAAHAQLVTAPGAGGPPIVRVIELNGTQRAFYAYYPEFRGGVRIALGDVTGDGVLDIITGAGPGGAPHVRVWNGVDLTEVGGFYAYDPAFGGGVFVAAADVDGDGRADIVTGAGAGGGPHVRVWSGADFHEIGGFFAYDPAFPGGVSVAAGDVDGDGRADVITGAGPGGGPHVRVWSGADFHEVGGFFAYYAAFPGGVNVAAGDINGDGRADIITGAGPGGWPHVRVWNATNFSEIGGFLAMDQSFDRGVQVAALDLTGDGRVEIITGAGPGGLPTSNIFDGANLAMIGSYFAFDPSSAAGVFVASVGKNSGLRFTSANATSFTRGAAGTFTVTTAGGTTPPALTLTGALPSGVSFTDNGDGTATLAGTPGASGTFPLTFTANNGSGPTVTQSFTLTVLEAPAITSASSTSFNIGSVGSSFTITTTGSPTPAISISGALPSGITFTDNNNGTATLAGTAASGTGGTYPLVITASNGVGTAATQNFTLSIQQGAAITSANATTFVAGVAGSFTITTTGSPAATSISLSGTLPSGVSFTNNSNGTATISGPPGATTGGTYSLTITASNGVGSPATQNFTLTVNQAPAITSTTSTTFTVGAAGSFTVTTTGFPTPVLTTLSSLPGGVTFTDNGNGTATIAGTPDAATGGTYPLTISASNGVGTAASQSFTLTVNQTPAITSANNATFVVGVLGTFTVTTSGFPTPSIARGGVALPTGVSFTDNGNGTGTLTGTPGAGTGGSYAISFTATNAAGPVTQPFTLTVQQPPAITSANTTTFTVGTPSTFTVTTTGFPSATIGAAGSLPGGVTFTDNGNGTATIAGTPDPATGGSYPITLTANNGVGTPATQNFTLAINQPAAVTSANATTFVVGTLGSFTITTSGTPTVTTITIGGAALPTGVSFTDNGDGTATLTGTPAAATGGTYALTFTATNGVGSPAVQNFTLTINQVPAITSANNVTFTIGAASSFTVTTTGFPAPSIARGGDTLPTGVTFVDNNNGTGTLAGTPAAGTAAPYALTFTATNVAGSSPLQNFTLTVACPAITLTPGAGALAGGQFGTAYSQTFGAVGGSGHTFAITAGALPSGLTLASNGALTGPPTNTGLFNFTVTATDAFGCTGSSAYSLIVIPNAVDESYSGGVGNTQFVVAPSPFSATPAVLVVGSVLSNDLGPGTLSAGPPTIGSTNGGSVAIGANGSFVYTPAIGFAGASDSFVYSLTDGNGVSDTATVTISLAGVVWYVNSSGANGDGRSHSPFNNLNNAQAPSAPAQIIFVHSGGPTTPGNITLKDSQALFGQGLPFTLNALSIPASTPPLLTGSVTLSNNVLVRGLNINAGGGEAFVGTNLTTGTQGFDTVNILGGVTGFNLVNVNSLSFVNGSISGVNGTDVRVIGGNGTMTFAGPITSTGGRSVEVANRTGGTVTFSGAISDSDQGMSLTNNGAATVAFTGGITLNTGVNAAFVATGGGTVTVTGTNTITTTTGTALNVANTNIGAAGLTFRSISANGAVNGIVLNNTGTGAFTITGNSAGLCGGQVTGGGATVTAPVPGDCTGGAILAATGAGVSLANTGAVSLTRVRIAGSADDGIAGSGVGALTIASTLIENNGNAVGDRGIDLTNLSGNGGISSSTVRGSAEHNVIINNTAATLTSFNVTSSQFTTNSIVTGDDGILLLTDGAGSITSSVTQSAFTDNKGDHFQAATTASAAGTINVTFSNNSLLTTPANDPNVIGGGITISPSGSADLTFTISNNNIQQAFDDAINLNLGTASTSGGSMVGTISNNTIGNAAEVDSGSESSNTITITSNGAGSTTVAVTGNILRQYGNGHGILVDNKEGSATVNATVTGNNIANPGTFALNGIHVSAGATSGPPADSGTTCAAVTGNSVANAGLATADIRLRQRFNTTIRLPGYAGAANDTTAVNSFVAGNNPGAEVTSIHNVGGGGNGFLGGTACVVPQ